MTRLERLVVLSGLLGLLGGMLLLSTLAALLGAAVGAAGAVPVVSWRRRLRTRVEGRLGAGEPVPVLGLRRGVLVRRALAQLGVLAGAWLLTAALPLAGGRTFAAVAAAATAAPAVLTAEGLLRRGSSRRLPGRQTGRRPGRWPGRRSQ